MFNPLTAFLGMACIVHSGERRSGRGQPDPVTPDDCASLPQRPAGHINDKALKLLNLFIKGFSEEMLLPDASAGGVRAARRGVGVASRGRQPCEGLLGTECCQCVFVPSCLLSWLLFSL